MGNKKAKKNRAKQAAEKAADSAGKGKLNLTPKRMGLLALAAVLFVGGMASLHAFDKKKRALHDLSVIGTGVPVMVQVHDPACPTCRRLKSAATAAMENFPDMAYRLADITTKEGKQFQTRYGVPHVTLLLFDPEGDHKHTISGLVDTEEINTTVSRVLDMPPPS